MSSNPFGEGDEDEDDRSTLIQSQPRQQDVYV